MRKPVHHLAEFKGTRFCVLASPFQRKMIKRMDASAVPMTLGDVLLALQQGTVDGALGTMAIYVTMHYQDASKYIVETGQPWVNEIAVMSRRWSTRCRQACESFAMTRRRSPRSSFPSSMTSSDAAQRKAWTAAGGELIGLRASGGPSSERRTLAGARRRRSDRAGVADAYWGNGMRVAIGERLGVAKLHLDLRRGDGPPGARWYNFAALTTTERLIDEQPEIAAGAVRAIVRTQKALKADPSLAAAVGERHSGPEEASLIAGLIARDAPFYDANISGSDRRLEQVCQGQWAYRRTRRLRPAGSLTIQQRMEGLGALRALRHLVRNRPECLLLAHCTRHGRRPRRPQSGASSAASSKPG